MRKNLRGSKATAIALASVMAMSLAACGKQDGSNQGGQTEQKEYVYVPEYLELDDNTNSSYSNMTVQGINCIIQITNGMKLPVRARSCLELIR